jgi:hypothetical protein
LSFRYTTYFEGFLITCIFRFLFLLLKVTEENIAALQQQKKLRDATMKSLNKELESFRTEISQLEARLERAQASTKSVEAEVFASFSASVGVTNIRDYEEKCLKKHSELLTQMAAVGKQLASLTAQCEYETKRDFHGVLLRVREQKTEVTTQLRAIEEEEQQLLHDEINARTLVKQSTTAVQQHKDTHLKVLARMKELQNRVQEMQSDSAALQKKLAGQDMFIERGRAQLHDVLLRARVDGVALPTVRHGGGGGVVADGSSEQSSSAASSSSHVDFDRELLWSGTVSGDSMLFATGTQSQDEQEVDTSSSSSNNSSSRRTSAPSVSVHYSQPENPTVKKYVFLLIEFAVFVTAKSNPSHFFVYVLVMADWQQKSICRSSASIKVR